MTDYTGIKTFDELIEREHDKIGTDSRNEYEERAIYQRLRMPKEIFNFQP